ncbi:MAG TPA: hypothetical protein PKA42_00465 [Candidatus Paceibacterota bacterium]|nr:hypothetical protein [Candidatus Paceibacterota bacterium]
MALSQTQLNQEGNLRQNSSRQRQRVGNVRVTRNQRTNQDWSYLQKQQLPINAPTDQIFSASYQNQGLQPQNLNEPTAANNPEIEPTSTVREGRSRFSRINSKIAESPGRFRNRRRRSVLNNRLAPQRLQSTTTASIAKKSLARARVTAINSTITLVGGIFWNFVQLPLAIIFLVSAGIYALLVSGVGVTGSVAAWWYNVKDVIYPLFAITGTMMHVLGLFMLLMIYLAYRSANLKPLSGSKEILKYAAFGIALLGYSTPILSLVPWILLVMLVVWLYPE